MISVKCDFCKKEYKTNRCWLKRNKYHCCSKECSNELKHQLGKTCECIRCGKKFLVEKHQHKKKYCSDNCRCRAYHLGTNPKRISVYCVTCDKIIKVTKSRADKNDDFYCSRTCWNKRPKKETHTHARRYLELTKCACGIDKKLFALIATSKDI